MRIVLIASGFADHSLELAGALAESHAVLALADAGALARERAGAPAPPGVEVQTWSQSDPLRRWGAAPTLAGRMRRWRPDLVLAHEHAHPHLTALMRWARRLAPLGLLVHDPLPHPGRDALFAERRSGEIRAQRALADQLFAHGEACAARLRELTGRPVVPVPHGPILRPAAPAPPPPGERRVLMFGRMEAYKGLEVLLAAARRLEADGAPIRLDIRGAGPELERLEGPLRALPGSVVRPGHASRAELLQALAGCDLVAAPYLHASASGVVAAAMANGRGVAASDVGGLPEMVRPGLNGRLAAPGDAPALAAALAAALPDAAALGRGAAALAKGAFAWRVAAETIAAAMVPRIGSRAA